MDEVDPRLAGPTKVNGRAPSTAFFGPAAPLRSRSRACCRLWVTTWNQLPVRWPDRESASQRPNPHVLAKSTRSSASSDDAAMEVSRIAMENLTENEEALDGASSSPLDPSEVIRESRDGCGGVWAGDCTE